MLLYIFVLVEHFLICSASPVNQVTKLVQKSPPGGNNFDYVPQRAPYPQQKDHNKNVDEQGPQLYNVDGTLFKMIRLRPKPMPPTEIVDFSKFPPIPQSPENEDLTEELEKRSGVRNTDLRWNGSILYAVDYTFTSAEIQVVREAAEELRNVVCIDIDLMIVLEWGKQKLGRPYVRITKNATGCSSPVGRMGSGEQSLYLKRNDKRGGCFHKGTIVHEMIHSLGFSHEQNRPDRDNFVTIHFKNVKASKRNNFGLRNNSLTFGVPYDYYSIMHYGPYHFTNNSNPTITAKIASIDVGSRGIMTLSDQQKLKRMYNCPDTCLVQSEGICTSDDDCCTGLYCVLYPAKNTHAGVCRDPNLDEYRPARSDGRPTDCMEYLLEGKKTSGVYMIYPDMTSTPVQVYCDMVTDGGGWTVVLQRGKRGEIREDFNRTWTEYEKGFGNIEGGDYNIGLNNLHSLTLEHDQELRVDLGDWKGNFVFGHYKKFWIEGSTVMYRLTALDYTGNITYRTEDYGLAIGDSMATSNGNLFTTYDHNHVKRSYGKRQKCSSLYGGGWWFDEDCSDTVLNGRYQHDGGKGNFHPGLFWRHWTIEYQKGNILKSAEMKVRNKFFQTMRYSLDEFDEPNTATGEK